MGVNKVVYGTTTLIDISDSTIAKNNILKGYKGYGANGDEVVGEIENVGVPVPSFIVEADDEEGALMIRATVTQQEGYTKGGSLFNSTYPKLTVSGDTATMSCGGASISRKVGASIATCTVTIDIVDSVGYVGVTATTFEDGAIGTFTQGKSSGTFTISNVVCDSIISVICNGMFSIDTSINVGSVGATSQYLVAPNTAGNYTAQIIAYDD